MFTPILSPEEARQLGCLLTGRQKIVLTCHMNPDGDAIGSMCAATLMLRRLGHEVTPVAPDPWPDFLTWLPASADIIPFTKQRERAEQAVREATLIVMLDHNVTSRMKELGTLVDSLTTPRLMIDHHLDPAPGCLLAISHPEMCATCEVLFRVADQMGWAEAMTTDEATCLYTGMMTDTGAFAYASSRPEIFEVIACLMRRGIDKDRIYRRTFWTATPDRLRLTGFLLYVKMEVVHPFHAAILTLTHKERRLFQTKNGDTEGIVNMPLQIQGMRLSIFLRQDTEDQTKVHVSTRSVDDFPCNELCERYFNGGGHLNAAGGSLTCSMDEAIAIAHQAIKDYATLLR